MPIIVAWLSPDNLMVLDVSKPRVYFTAADFGTLLIRLIHIVVRDAEHTACDRATVEKNRIFSIVSTVAHNCHNQVLTVRMLFPVKILHIT